MPAIYDVKAAIINESSTHIERLAAKIVCLSGKMNDAYIRTFPFLGYARNRTAFAKDGNDLYAYNTANYLGITFISYRYANYIRFVSSFKTFPLNEGDLITLRFKNEDELSFTFTSRRSSVGMLSSNTHFISDDGLHMIAGSDLEYWQLTNPEEKVSLFGGFVETEGNKQYKSGRTGKKLFRLMAENILQTKEFFREANSQGVW